MVFCVPTPLVLWCHMRRRVGQAEGAVPERSDILHHHRMMKRNRLPDRTVCRVGGALLHSDVHIAPSGIESRRRRYAEHGLVCSYYRTLLSGITAVIPRITYRQRRHTNMHKFSSKTLYCFSRFSSDIGREAVLITDRFSYSPIRINAAQIRGFE